MNKRSAFQPAAAVVVAFLLAGCSDHRADYQLVPVSAASGADRAWVLDSTNGRVSLCEGSPTHVKCSPQADPALAGLLSQVPNK